MKTWKHSILLVVFLLSLPLFGMGKRGDFIGSAGIGLMTSPTLVLLSPELAYVYDPDLSLGGLIQMGFGDGVVTTVSGTVRYLFGRHERVRPSVEAGLGLALASSVFTSSVGVHIMGGMGFDYVIDKRVSVGSMVRLNFMPPLKSFMLSWPIVVARFLL